MDARFIGSLPCDKVADFRRPQSPLDRIDPTRENNRLCHQRRTNTWYPTPCRSSASLPTRHEVSPVPRPVTLPKCQPKMASVPSPHRPPSPELSLHTGNRRDAIHRAGVPMSQAMAYVRHAAALFILSTNVLRRRTFAIWVRPYPIRCLNFPVFALTTARPTHRKICLRA